MYKYLSIKDTKDNLESLINIELLHNKFYFEENRTKYRASEKSFTKGEFIIIIA